MEHTLTSNLTQPSSLGILPDGNEVPPTIGKYKLQHEVGRGNCGVVFRGFDPFVQRDVAVKVALSDAPGDKNQARRHEREFFAEAHAAGKLQHPHIVSLYDAGIAGELSYIVMEFIEGETLSEWTGRRGKTLPTDQVVDVMFKCAKALDYSHKKNVLHRDIKPSNIMLDADGVAKIMDFSIAEVMNESSVRPESVVGSPAYMAPEQVERKNIGPPADLYSLGAVMYHLLTGDPPFVAEEMSTLFDMVKYTPAPDLRDVRPDLPSELADVVARLLEKEPGKRFQTGQELAEQLLLIFDRLQYADRQIKRNENRDSLRGLRFFQDFEEQEIDELLSFSTMLTFHAGDVIIREGDIDNAFYIIAVGGAEIQKAGKPMMSIGKGDVFGEIGFLTAAKRTASVVALTEVLALKVNSTAMNKASRDTQLRYYKVFCETLIYRLSLTSAKLSARS